MRGLLLLIPVLLFLTGCLPLQLIDPDYQESKTLIVPSSPFASPVTVSAPPRKVNYSEVKKADALRVERIGRQLLTANPQIGMQPHFAVYATTKPEIFHTGTYILHITEGLADRCDTDSKLAALLAHEFAEMVAEREALAHPKMRVGERRPPADVMIGNGIGDHHPDQTHIAELAKYDARRKYSADDPLPTPDPKKLAATYLEKAGFDQEDLESIVPLLKEAERTYLLEKQFKNTPTPQQWQPQAAPGMTTGNTTQPAATPQQESPRPSPQQHQWLPESSPQESKTGL